MNFILITNNEQVLKRFKDKVEISYKNVSCREILVEARDLIHKGCSLETHPLSGSIKPNENPFKSILLSRKSGAVDLDSLVIIENSIATFDKFSCEFSKLSDEMLCDFRLLDLTLIESALTCII